MRKNLRKFATGIVMAMTLSLSMGIIAIAAPLTARDATLWEAPAPRGNYISSGTCMLSDESGTTIKLGIDGDTLSHYNVDKLGLKLSLDYKSTSSGSYSTIKTWSFTATNDSILSKSFSYIPSKGAGYYRLRGYHYINEGSVTENLYSTGSWMYID